MIEFLSMGGYGWFLWPAYLVTFIAVITNVFIARRAHSEARRAALRRIQLDEGDDV